MCRVRNATYVSRGSGKRWWRVSGLAFPAGAENDVGGAGNDGGGVGVRAGDVGRGGGGMGIRPDGKARVP